MWSQLIRRTAIAYMSRCRHIGCVWMTAKTYHTKTLACPQNLVLVWTAPKKSARQRQPPFARVILANELASRGHREAAPKNWRHLLPSLSWWVPGSFTFFYYYGTCYKAADSLEGSYLVGPRTISMHMHLWAILFWTIRWLQSKQEYLTKFLVIPWHW